VKTLVIGVGNAGRQDDGLGPALVERLAGVKPPERVIVQTPDGAVDAFWAYQLNIEDAAAVREYDRVVFVDASEGALAEAREESEQAFGSPMRPLQVLQSSPPLARGQASQSYATLELGGVMMAPLAPAATIAFTTHEMSPASVLALGEELYGRTAEGFLLTIRGLQWEFAEGLSAEAERNLAEACRILAEFLKRT